MSKEKIPEIETHKEKNPQLESTQSDSVCRGAFDRLILGGNRNSEQLLTDSNTEHLNLINNSYASENNIDSEEDRSNLEDCNIDFSDDSNLSELNEIDQQIASAIKDKLTLEEVTHILSSRKKKADDEDDHEDNQLVKIFCPFSFDFIYIPIKLANLLKLLWSSGIETHDTHFVQHGSIIRILFSSITHANRFLKFCCTPDCSYLVEEHPQKLNWCNLVNIQKKWKFKIKPTISKDYTTLQLVIQISFPKRDVGFILNQFHMLSDPFPEGQD